LTSGIGNVDLSPPLVVETITTEMGWPPATGYTCANICFGVSETINIAYDKRHPASRRGSGRLPSSDLRALLREFRDRIDPSETALGPQPRPPWRRGKPVTQEEIADSIGVSRNWYGMLESEHPPRASIVLLDRLATILMLSVDERTMLFARALPELDFSQQPMQKEANE
jgi:DNA-binding XRE family transcriptional regulator